MDLPRRFLTIYCAIVALNLIGAGALHAQGGYSVTLAQVDTSRYPTITLYVNVRDASGNPVGGLQKADLSVTEDGSVVEISDFAGTGDVRPVDIVFVFDTTSSMYDEIEGVKQTCIEFAQELKDQRRDYRLGLVAFGDNIRGVYRNDGELTDSAEEFKGWIGALRAIGGDGPYENDFAAIKQASRFRFRGNAQKVFILITDAPPHHYDDLPDGGFQFDDPDLTVARAVEILKEKAITLYAITVNYPDFRHLAEETHGEFHQLTPSTDFTGIIDKLGTTISLQYRIVYKSPRPTYDGTRRNIVVSVQGHKGGGAYVEQHLVNFKSDIWVALAFLFPLLFALALPLPFLFLQRQRGTPTAPPVSPSGSMPATVPPDSPPPGSPGPMARCPYCDQPLRPQARFCGRCGKALTPSSQPVKPMASALTACPFCGAMLRPTASFCPRCGQRR